MRFQQDAPVPGGDDEKALWRLIRDALEEAGISSRQLARELAGPDATDSKRESERRKIAKWISEKEPTIPSAKEARRLAKKLGKPADYFVRPQPRKVDVRVRELEEEVAQLRQEVARLKGHSEPA